MQFNDEGASSFGMVDRDVYVFPDSVQEELDCKRQQVALFLGEQLIIVPLLEGEHFYVGTQQLEQFQRDHRHRIYYWYMDLF